MGVIDGCDVCRAEARGGSGNAGGVGGECERRS